MTSQIDGQNDIHPFIMFVNNINNLLMTCLSCYGSSDLDP